MKVDCLFLPQGASVRVGNRVEVRRLGSGTVYNGIIRGRLSEAEKQKGRNDP